MVFDEQVVKRLLNCDWLSNCGRTDVEIPGVQCEWVTKNEAFKKISGLKWENTCLEGQNEVTRYLFLNHNEEYNRKWNERVEYIKETYVPVVEKNVREKLKQYEFSEEILTDIRFNVIGILVVSSYKEYYHSVFFEKLLDIYTSGHLPCGWHGRYPKGVIMVY